MKKLTTILITSLLICATTTSAQVAIRADVCVAGYKTTCFDPAQVSSVFGLGLQLGADYDIHITKRFYLTPGLYWSYRAASGNSPAEDGYGTELLQKHPLKEHMTISMVTQTSKYWHYTEARLTKSMI